jgi:hypothetical protein
MRTRLLSFLVLLLVPALALAQPAGQPLVRLYPLGTLLDGIALNAAAGARTFRLTNTGGSYAKANLVMKRTRVAGTDLTMTCTSSQDGGTTNATRQTCAYDSLGVCSHVTATWKSATSATETLGWEVRIAGWKITDCVVASTSAGGTDLLTVTGDLVLP